MKLCGGSWALVPICLNLNLTPSWMFCKIVFLNTSLIDLALKNFENMAKQKLSTTDDKMFSYRISMPFLEIHHINLAVIRQN